MSAKEDNLFNIAVLSKIQEANFEMRPISNEGTDESTLRPYFFKNRKE